MLNMLETVTDLETWKTHLISQNSIPTTHGDQISGTTIDLNILIKRKVQGVFEEYNI